MFSGDSFPLGPNGQFPRNRTRSYGVMLIPPVSMQDTYLSGHNTVSKLPNLEKDFHSSVSKAKMRMKHGNPVRTMRGSNSSLGNFRPRFAPISRLGGEEEYEEMDSDVAYESGNPDDEGDTDDSVGIVNSAATGLAVRGLFRLGPPIVRILGAIGSRAIIPATEARPVPGRSMRRIVEALPVQRGSWGGWMRGTAR